MATEIVGIELQLRGEEGVFADLQKLDNMLKGFSGSKGRTAIEIDLGQSRQKLLALNGEINETKDSLDSMRKKLRELRNEQKGLTAGTEEFERLSDRIRNTNSCIEEESDHLKRLQVETRDVTQRIKELNLAMKDAPKTWSQWYKQMSTGIKHIGQNMQTLGNALTKLGSPFETTMRGLLYGAGNRVLGLMTEGLGNAFTRYDTMRKYELIMASYEKANYSAAHSKEVLDEAVQGLPTSLDEIMSSAQRFTATTGDIERGTQVAIAANNAFLASMSTETQKYQGMMQLQDVLGGKKMNAREWQALANSMMPAIRKMGEALGYQGEELDDYVAKVQQGKVANKDFLDALVMAGYGKDSVLGQVAEYSKQTWESLASNTKTAFARMGEGVLTALNEVSEGYNGKGLIQNLLDEKGIIDQWSKSLQGWIKAHPDEIIGFFEQLKSIDFKGLGRGLLDGAKTFAEAVKLITGFFGDKGLYAMGKFLALAGPFGRATTLAGGLLKGLSHPLGAVLATIMRGTSMAGGELSKRDGIFGMIKNVLAGRKGISGAKEAIETIEGTAEAGASVASKMGKFSTALSGFFKGWAEIAVMVGGSAFVGWASIKMIKNAFKDIRELGTIVADIDWGNAAKGLLLAGDFITALIGVGNLISKNPALMKDIGIGTLVAGLVTAIGSTAFMADMKLIKSGFKALYQSAEYVGKTIDALNEIASVNDVGGVKTKVRNAITTFNQIKGLFKGHWDASSSQWTGGLDKFPKSVRKSLANISETIGNMKNSINTLNDIAGMEINQEGIDAVVPAFNDALGSLKDVIVTMPSYWEDSKVVDQTGNASASLANLKSSFDAVGKILEGLPDTLSAINNLSHSGSFDTLPDKMKVLGDALKGAYDALNSGIGNGDYMSTNLDNFRQALKSAKFAVKHLQELGGMEVSDGAMDNIKSIFSKIEETFSPDAVEPLTTNIDAFVTTIRDALAAFEEFNTDIEISPTIKLSSAFDTSVKNAAKKISGAEGTIRGAVNGIDSTYTKRITVHIIASAVVSGIGNVRRIAEETARSVSGDQTIGSATGGKVYRTGTLYRSGGGSIFRPRGTDTVPAMLTEGEYVHRKQAVDFFGTDFMRKVNAMDVRGAMQALLAKAGSSTNINRQSVVNNTVNNNQRVTQYVTTNSPSFAKARMSRAVGAL